MRFMGDGEDPPQKGTQMMTFILGGAGALTALGLLALGFWLGGRANRGGNARPPSNGERERLSREQAAFRQLQNYSVERAYGLVDDGEDEER